VDSQYSIGNPEWDASWEWRGFDAGTNLKSASGWNFGGNGTDLYGFSGLAGGFRDIGGPFVGVGTNGHWFASTEYSVSHALTRNLNYDYPEVNLFEYFKEGGFSVRCLRDY